MSHLYHPHLDRWRCDQYQMLIAARFILLALISGSINLIAHWTYSPISNDAILEKGKASSCQSVPFLSHYLRVMFKVENEVSDVT